MRKKLITLTLLAFAANVANGAKIQTNQLIHSDDFNKNWITGVVFNQKLQQKNKFKTCRDVLTSTIVVGKHYGKKRTIVAFEGSCSEYMDKFGSHSGNKPNKGWTTMVSKDYDGITFEMQQKNNSKNCRGVKINEDQSADVVWSGSCVELMTLKYKGTKFTKGWTTLFVSHGVIQYQKHSRLESWRIVDSVGDDSVGAV